MGKLTKCRFFAGLLAVIWFVAATDASHAKPEWNSTTAQSAAVTATIDKAVLRIAASLVDDVEKAEKDIEEAKEAIEDAVEDPASTDKGVNAAQETVEAVSAVGEFGAKAAVGLAYLTGYVSGVGWSQILGLVEWCWDPLCDATFEDPTNKFVPAKKQDIRRIIPELVFNLTGQRVRRKDFTRDAAIVWDLMAKTIELYINAARGAASGTARDWKGVLDAVDELKPVLRELPGVMLAAADTLEALEIVPSRVTLAEGRSVPLQQAVSEALASVDALLAAAALPPDPTDRCLPNNGGPGCDNSRLMRAAEDARNILTGIETQILPRVLDSRGEPRRLVSYLNNLTREDLRAFADSCRRDGPACLPAGEVFAADRLLQVAGVFFPSMQSFGVALAELAANADGREEAALFDLPARASVSYADLLRTSATVLSSQGTWLNIDLDASPLAIEARQGISKMRRR